MITVIWTGMSEDWLQDQILLKRLPKKYKIVHLPLSKIAPIELSNIDVKKLSGAEQLIVSSKNSARLLKSYLENNKLKKKIFCFGQQTFQQVVNIKEVDPIFDKVSQSAEEFTDFLLKNLNLSKKSLYLAAKKSAYPIAQQLSSKGFDCEEVIIYETLPLKDNEQQTLTALSSLEPSSTVFCFFSPSSVKTFVDIVQSQLEIEKSSGLKSAICLCIGRTTLKIAETYFQNCKLSNDISKESLIAALLTLGDLA